MLITTRMGLGSYSRPLSVCVCLERLKSVCATHHRCSVKTRCQRRRRDNGFNDTDGSRRRPGEGQVAAQTAFTYQSDSLYLAHLSCTCPRSRPSLTHYNIHVSVCVNHKGVMKLFLCLSERSLVFSQRFS